MAANYVAHEIMMLNVGQPYSTQPLGTTFAAATTNTYPAQGFRCNGGVNTAIYRVFKIPAAATMTTGITVEILACCDSSGSGNNADIRGTVTNWDVTIGIQTDGTSLGDDSEFTGGTLASQAGTITMPTAVGKLKKVAITNSIVQCTNAAGAIAAGSWCTLRVRRLGSTATDTNIGDVLLAGISAWVY